MCFPCCTSKPKIPPPQDTGLVASTPFDPVMIDQELKKRAAERKIERVVNGLREGQVFPREASK